ncbi:hypothetical protein [Saccharothrix coeruleofusca]|uniref:Uncharacterized protein n=1 Tax=Saccharothrix coeruleofusca TaxID=33919 RepID=A0A918AKT1_9PSEU|nr:hypothetical protein [Saccharothrix coeruleofusca]MBP2334243.1 hypothetical protein [Saccharothrix coeruleofusca]GGP42392.1 hypothetical protein GCM10010185_12340 [Saccharothrix coeruleofusca]
MLDGIAQWWDGVELWLAQLAFPFQFALVMAVLLPACLGVARFIDRVVDDASARISGDPQAEPPVGASPEDVREPRQADAGSRS